MYYKRLFGFNMTFMLCDANWETEKFHVIKRYKEMDYPYYQLFIPFKYKKFFGIFFQISRVSIFNFNGPIINKSIVRDNLIKIANYYPYCGNDFCTMPKTKFNGDQFVCKCGWTSQFPKDFITLYKKKWDIK